MSITIFDLRFFHQILVWIRKTAFKALSPLQAWKNWGWCCHCCQPHFLHFGLIHCRQQKARAWVGISFLPFRYLKLRGPRPWPGTTMTEGRNQQESEGLHLSHSHPNPLAFLGPRRGRREQQLSFGVLRAKLQAGGVPGARRSLAEANTPAAPPLQYPDRGRQCPHGPKPDGPRASYPNSQAKLHPTLTITQPSQRQT